MGYQPSNTTIGKDRAMIQQCDLMNKRLSNMATKMDAVLFFAGVLIGDLAFLFYFIVGKTAG